MILQFKKKLNRRHDTRPGIPEMPEISGYNGYISMARHFDKGEVSGIRDRTGQWYRRCEDTLSLDKGDNFVYRLFRE